MSRDVSAYMQSQFCELMAQMFPQGVAWQSPRHVALVRTFLAGAYVWNPADSKAQKHLEQMIMEATADNWVPGSEWNWKTGIPN